ncbi:HAD-IA family hydrolase [Xylophilus rhododendri]|uniref:HAD-IA family hydrolase n=1 Tax=Xylophilus rhododendri TaxID=2697032 RepID=A0A857IYW1_9BURK|nr:HAD family phosphatase [Xylophilus rhododendri]QHI96770.1 HAD-IA family hydrolase [Xylophilus rhododendri]
MTEGGKIKAYLVDLDGTLADTSEANFRAYAQALQEGAGIDIDRATFEREAFGRNWRQFLPGMIERAGVQAEPAGIARRKTELYRQTLVHARFNEALVLLLGSRADGVHAALVTTASAANVASVLAQRPDIAALFDLVVTGDDVQRHKPDPEAYVQAAQRLGVAAGDCLVIEDSDIGMGAGLAFGARVLRVSMQQPAA